MISGLLPCLVQFPVNTVVPGTLQSMNSSLCAGLSGISLKSAKGRLNLKVWHHTARMQAISTRYSIPNGEPLRDPFSSVTNEYK
jgi:hypothetical protein